MKDDFNSIDFESLKDRLTAFRRRMLFFECLSAVMFILVSVYILMDFINKKDAPPEPPEKIFDKPSAYIPPRNIEDEVLGVDYGDERPDIYDLECVEFVGDYVIRDDVPLPHDEQLVVQSICDKYDVSYPLVLAVIEHESNFKEEYEGTIVGLMQVSTKYHSERAEDLGVSLYSKMGNVETGVSLLHDLLIRYDGDPDKALQAYNGGDNKANYASYILFRELYWDDIVYGGVG